MQEGGKTITICSSASHYKKPIFIYNEIDEDLNIKEEILGLNPIFLNTRLNIIKRFI
ncbi:MAG: hypothetical protein HYT08_03580 [Candidatus Levybacteria bacterium]|nr:hypothetical protein [Candidatus Levybacteria bacterium]